MQYCSFAQKLIGKNVIRMEKVLINKMKYSNKF